MTRFALVLALLAAACSKKDDQPAPAAGSSAPTAPAPTAPVAPTPSGAEAEAQKAMDEAVKAKEAAQQAAEKALEAAKSAQGDVEQITKELNDLGAKVDAAMDQLAKATTDAERTKAKAALDELRKQKAEIEAKIAQLKAKGAP